MCVSVCVSLQSVGGGGGGEEEEGRGESEADREWEEYTKEREKRLRLMEELWEDEDTRKRKRKCVIRYLWCSVCVCVCWVWVIERKGGKIELKRERESRVWAALVGVVACGYPGVHTNSAYPLPLWTLAMSCVFCGIATLYRLKLVYVADVYRDSGHQGSSRSFIMYRVFRPL